MFIVLLTSIVSASNHTKCISLNNQKPEFPTTLVNLNPNKYYQKLNTRTKYKN